MKSSPGSVDAAVMRTDTLTAPPPEVSEPADAFDPADSVESAHPAATPSPASPAADPDASAVNRAAIEEEVKEFVKISSVPAPDQDAVAEHEAAKSAEPGPVSSPGLVKRVLMWPVQCLIGLLILLDLPFCFLGKRIKSFVGWLAIGTAVMAAGVWLYGPKLAGRPTPREDQPSSTLTRAEHESAPTRSKDH